MSEKIFINCKHYKGDIPCKLHKEYGVHCENCQYYDKIDNKILIIKLGAIGDVIRTTPLLHKIRSVYPNSQIHWITKSPEILSSSFVDIIYSYNFSNCELLKNIQFDISINLEKDKDACALQNQINSLKKFGFKLYKGNCFPIGNAAKIKWLTGLFDDINKENTKSYIQEIFDICGYSFNKEEYILEIKKNIKWKIPNDKYVIGLNTGCGNRWITRLWPDTYWIELSKKLKKKGYFVLLLGGEQEHKKNKWISSKAGIDYFGYFSLTDFIDLVNQCHLVVTSVTMALHIALGLKKKIVLFNNIFNSNEFELYGNGIIIEPDVNCKGCFKNICEFNCMELIKPDYVFAKLIKLLD